MNNKLLVIMPMCGEGKRFAQTGEQTLKPFIKVDGEYMFVKAMNSLKYMLPDFDLRFVLVFREEAIAKYRVQDIVGNIKDTDIRICSVFDKTAGPAETVLHGLHYTIRNDIEIASDYENIPTIVMDCDFEVRCDAFSDLVYKNTIEHKASCILMTRKSDNPRYSYVKADTDGTVYDIAEKKVISENAIVGVYYFSSVYTLLRYINILADETNFFKNGEPYISDVIKIMLKRMRVLMTELNGKHDMYHSFGTPEELKEYESNNH